LNRKQTYYFIFLLILSATTTLSQTVNVRIFSKKDIKSIVVTTYEGEYDVIADTTVIHFDINDIIQVTSELDKISIRSLDGYHGIFNKIKLVAKNDKSTFKIKPAEPDLKARIYDDDLMITLRDKHLLIVNEVELESYIAGVVESEAGYKAHPEFYKTQSLICRTWALHNFDKHLAEGFQLCDDVHCQVYFNKCLKEHTIINATKFTEGLVIVDTTMALITATFHSNCGGQTANSEDVWGRPRSYLQSVSDTFCRNEKNSFWEKRIPVATFQSYLQENGIVLSNTDIPNDTPLFPQAYRKAFFNINGPGIPLKKIRADLKLRSTFFSVQKDNNDFVLKGRGFGHGVGLCQEGAMKMAKMGFSYEDIVKHYYKNTIIISMRALNFFTAPITSMPVPKDSLNVTPSEKPGE